MLLKRLTILHDKMTDEIKYEKMQKNSHGENYQ